MSQISSPCFSPSPWETTGLGQTLWSNMWGWGTSHEQEVANTSPLPQTTESILLGVLCPQAFQKIEDPSVSLLAVPRRPLLHLGTASQSLQQSQISLVTMGLLPLWDAALQVPRRTKSPQVPCATWAPFSISIAVVWRPLHGWDPTFSVGGSSLPQCLLGFPVPASAWRVVPPSPCLPSSFSVPLFMKFQTSHTSTCFPSWLLCSLDTISIWAGMKWTKLSTTLKPSWSLLNLSYHVMLL